jgi:hypothetical protein
MFIFNIQTLFAQCAFTLTGPQYTFSSPLVYNITSPTTVNFNTFSWVITSFNSIGGSQVVSSGSGTGSGNSFSIPYATNQLFGLSYQLVVTNTSPSSGESCSSTFYTYANCDQATNSPMLNNTTINQAVSNSLITINGLDQVIGQTFRVYGVLTIDHNVIFQNCFLFMMEGSQIIVNGNYAAFESSSLLNSCSLMWRGINIINGGTIKTTDSYITGAQYAINFVNQIASNINYGTVFDKNYISITSSPNASTQPTNFAGFGDFEISGLDQLPRGYLGITPPITYGSRPLAGIRFTNLNEFTIGNGASGRTRIHDIKNAIILNNARVNVINCDFWNIDNDGIQVNASSTLNNSSIFDYKFLNNRFDNVTRWGIRLQNCFGSADNKIYIRGNKFNSGLLTTPITNTRNAINVNNTIASITNISIINNETDFTTTAIVCNNVVSQNASNNAADISGNIIRFGQTESSFNSITRRGISLSGSNNLLVRNNDINRLQGFLNPTNVSSVANRLIGIEISTLANGMIRENTLTNLGTCVRYTGSNLQTQNFCNSLVSSFSGFFLNNATISKQGTFNQPQDNKWINFGNVLRVNSSVPLLIPIIWFHRTNQPNFDVSVNTSSQVVIATPADNSSNICGIAPTGPGGPNNPNFLTGDSLVNEIVTQELNSLYSLDPFQQISASQLYELIRENGALLDSFPELAAFYNSLGEKFEGQYIEYLAMLNSGNYTAAFALLEEMNPNGELQNDLYITLRIANKFREFENYVLSSEDTLELIPIANKTVFRSGHAVINARAMLGIEIQDIMNNFREGNFTNKVDEIKYYLIGDNYYFFDSNELPVQHIEVFNSLGQLLYSKRGCNYQRGLFPSESIIRVYGNNSNKSFRGL